MAILVTGASGFVGAALCEALLRRGERVIGVDRARSPGDAGADRSAFRFHAADLRDPGALDAVLRSEPVDRLVIGAAVTAGPERERSDPASVVQVNVAAVADAVRAAAEAGIGRIVHLGSGAVYGDSAFSADALVEEETALRPRSLYALTKQAGEAIALRLAEVHGLDLTAIRLGTCFGPFERDTGLRDTLSAPHQILRLAEAGSPILLPRPARRDWLYVRDAVAGILAVLDAPALPHRIYNVAAGHVWSLAEWCERLRRDLAIDWSVVAPEAANVNLYDPADRAPMSIARLTADTAFRPRFDLAAAAADFLSWRRDRAERRSRAETT